LYGGVERGDCEEERGVALLVDQLKQHARRLI